VTVLALTIRMSSAKSSFTGFALMEQCSLSIAQSRFERRRRTSAPSTTSV
jgi:hypothetical protein